MLGYLGVSNALRTHLLATMPAELDLLATDNGPVVAAGDDPEGDSERTDGANVALNAVPALYALQAIAVEKVGIDDWPFVVIDVGDLDEQKLEEVEDSGAKIYRRRYPVTIYFYARGDGYEYTESVRARGMLALTECLLKYQHISSPGGVLQIDENTWKERKSPVGQLGVDDADAVAAGMIETIVYATERLSPRPLPLGEVGDVHHVFVDTQMPPEHPALQ